MRVHKEVEVFYNEESDLKIWKKKKILSLSGTLIFNSKPLSQSCQLQSSDFITQFESIFNSYANKESY
jgi:hypothetical protein